MRYYEFNDHEVDFCGVGPVFEDEGCYYFMMYFEGFCLISQSFKTTVEAAVGRNSFIEQWSN